MCGHVIKTSDIFPNISVKNEIYERGSSFIEIGFICSPNREIPDQARKTMDIKKPGDLFRDSRAFCF